MAEETSTDGMDSIKWFHSIPLNDGTVTPGLDSSMAKLEQICLPKDLTGKTVLDICLLYTSPSPRDATLSRMPSSA